jgi:hypothetical protein
VEGVVHAFCFGVTGYMWGGAGRSSCYPYVHLAIVEAKSLLIEIPKQVEGLKRSRSVTTTLEPAPVVLHAVGMDPTIHICGRMIDYRILEFLQPRSFVACKNVPCGHF